MEIKIAVIGLGYVGLPLARLFSTKYKTVGFDMNQKRVDALMAGHDATLEVSDELLQDAINNHGFVCTTDLDKIRECNFYVVAVPTPVDVNNRPDLRPLWGASETVGKVISKGDIVVYESTVYPGVTEEECLPVVERVSGLKFNVDFYAGYSPERINPGDKLHTVEKIKKVTSGSTPEIADIVDGVYNSVLINGTHKAPSIKVAEASKIIENSQRDVNIAFMNELAKIFNAMGIDTRDVIEAAASKWNFIKLSPGLVGGHCISVDPWFLVGDYPRLAKVIDESMKTNDSQPEFVLNRIHEIMKENNITDNRKVGLYGLTYKENVDDYRESPTLQMLELQERHLARPLKCYDPFLENQKIAENLFYNFDEFINDVDMVVIMVKHEHIKQNWDKLKGKVILDCFNICSLDGVYHI